MNKRQKEVIQLSLNDEKAVLESLKNNYTSALVDIKRNIRELQANPLTQSKAYQLEFQKQLEKQLTGIIDNLSGKNFSSIADYMNTCYNQGFLGSMYDLHGQGVPLIVPINQNQVLKAVQKTGDDIKLSNKLGVHTKELKSQVLSELQRGLATQLSYSDIARNISNRGQADMNRSMLIARTEGHRVQNEAKIDAFNSAKSKGADIVKQWDSTLDGATRPEHQKLDGQVRELDEDFTVGSYSASCPGSFGDPYMDCNCRCCMLQRARWALDEDELKTLQGRAEFFGLDKSDSFDDFKEKYLNAVDNLTESGIIKETAKQPITKITDSAINKVPNVRIDGYTKEECDFIQNEHKKLLEYSMINNDSKEVAFVFNSDLANRREFLGEDDRLNLGNELYGKDLFIMHNHPRNSSYSFNDIVEFVGNDNIKTMTIVKNNGSVETLTKSKEYDKLSMLKELQRSEKNNIKRNLESEYRKIVDKFLNKHEQGGFLKWTK